MIGRKMAATAAAAIAITASLSMGLLHATMPAQAAASQAPICSTHDVAGGKEIDVTWLDSSTAPALSWHVHDGERIFDWSDTLNCGRRYVTWLWLSGEVRPDFTWGDYLK